MRAINRSVVALAAITLLGMAFAAVSDAQNKIGGQAVVPYRIDPTGRACTTTSPFVLYLSQLYNCQSSAYAAYTTGGGGFANPMSAVGDLILGGTAGAAGRLPIGSNTFVLTSNGTTAGWAAPAAASSATNLAGGLIGSLPYQSAASTTLFLAGNTAATDQVPVSHGSGAAALAPTLSNAPALSAANMTSFPASLMTTSTVLVAAQEPAHTGDMTNSAGSLVTAVGAIGGKTVSLAGNFTTTGAFNVTLAVPSSSTWTLPAGPSTLLSTTGNALTATTSTNLAGGLLGSLPYQSAVNTTALLAGNTTSAKQYFTQTGTGTVSAIPVWGAIAAADVPAALSSTTSVNGTTIPSSSTLTKTIASGTSTMGTTLIATTACATVVTTAATGTLSTDAFTWNNNADVSAVTGYTPATAGSLRIYAYPTTDNVNFRVCNPTTASITPSAITLNWRVTR